MRCCHVLSKGVVTLNRGKRLVGVAVLLASTAVAGCGASGSATTCGDFEGMSTGDQKSAVSNALKDHGQDTSPFHVDEAWLSAKGYCFLHSGSDQIGNIFGS
jgi:hypothetical protein